MQALRWDFDGDYPDARPAPFAGEMDCDSATLARPDVTNAGAFQLSVHQSMQSVEQTWRRLQANPVVSPHQDYDWCKAWVDNVGRPLLIIEGRLEGETEFLLPLELVAHRLFRSAGFIASEKTNINTGIMTDRFLQAANPEMMRELAARLRLLLPGVDVLSLCNMPIHWRGWHLPFSMLAGVENQNHAFQLDIADSFEETLAQINAKHRRKKFRSTERKLEALGGYEYATAVTSRQKAAFLDQFFRLKAQRFNEVGLPDVFMETRTQSFFLAAALTPDKPEDFTLRLHAIRMKDDPDNHFAAVAGVSRKGDHVICHFTTIGDGPARNASPGELLFYRMIEQYAGEGIKLFDFGLGEARFKQSWSTTETVQKDVFLPLTAIGRLAALKGEASIQAKKLIKLNPALYAFIQRIRSRSNASCSPPCQNAVLDEE